MRKRKIFFYVIIGVLSIVVVVSLFVVKPMYEAVYKPNIKLKNGQDERFFYVRTGFDLADVQKTFQKLKIMDDTASFGWLARRMKYVVKPGKYRIEDGMNNLKLVRLLRSGEQVPVNIAIKNIRFKHQVAGLFGKYLEADSAEVMQLLSNKNFLDSIDMQPETAITLFIANTYEFKWNTSAREALLRMKKEYDKVWTSSRISKAEEMKMSRPEIMSLAAIVQEETARKDEAPRIAGVYLNRLKKNMKLQADPTVKYIVMRENPGREVKRIYFKDLKIDDAYNTYVKNGLPPGPIIIPDVWAIDAVLNAENHDYIYFAAKEDFSGYHNFTASAQEHMQNAKKYRNELDNRNIR